MNEQIMEKVLQYLEAAEKAAQSGGEIVAGEVQLLLHEIAVFGFWENIFMAFSNLVFLILTCSFIKICYKHLWPKADWSDRDCKPIHVLSILSFITTFILIICSFLSLFSFPEYTRKAIKAGVAPRVYVIEYIADLAKSTKQR